MHRVAEKSKIKEYIEKECLNEAKEPGTNSS